MSRSALVREHLFDEMSRYLQGIDPRSIRPLEDRCLVRELSEEDQARLSGDSSLAIAVERTGYRYGLVVSVGPGDKSREKRGWHMGKPNQPILDQDGVARKVALKCERRPMLVKPGDLVLFDKRKDLEFFIEGQSYQLVNEEQSIVATVEE